MSLKEIVNVSITTQTTAVSKKGFGLLLILGESAVNQAGGGDTFPLTARIRHYDSTTAVAADYAAGTPEYMAAATFFAQSPAPTKVAIGRKDPAETWAAAFTAIELIDRDWYAVLVTSRDKADVTAVAAWVEANQRLFGTASSEADIVNLDLASDLGTADPPAPKTLAGDLYVGNYRRTFLLYHGGADGGATDPFPEAAWFGKQLTTDPGATTWMFKALATISTSPLTVGESKNARAKNANVYEVIGGAKITREGKTTSGEYIDIVRGVDWLEARIAERIFSRLANLPKVPYTDAGVAIFETQVRAQLADGIGVGLLAADPPPVVSVPRVADVAFNDRAGRTLPDIRFTANLAGAIHSVTVNGVVAV